MDDRQHVSRRKFLQRLGALGVVGAGAPSLLVACDSGGSNGGNVARTFEVTVEEITSSYPYSDQNNIGTAFAIDGGPGEVITLERGRRYEFALQESVQSGAGPAGFAHPFYIGRTAEGQGGDEFSQGVENAKSTSGSVFFTPPSEAPDTLYYQCDIHVYMGGKIEITG
ncbi:MAG: twin-arginine translocation signal domain-containing protein [Salinibacter sp.]|uniref:twin-arginine translocation signal domain-containing protein n=1 Tax=Salinibacter sp. TaxID=2065818 RepID=UPI0035D4698F